MWEAEVLHDISGLLEEMNETMIEERGIGLAANQIGRSLRVFILKDKASSNAYIEFINPTYVMQEELVDFETEGCLSIPGTMGATKRFRVVHLKWVDRNGEPREALFEDMEAFAVQHEMDHLDGKLYVDQFGPVKKELVLNKHKKFLRLTKGR